MSPVRLESETECIILFQIKELLGRLGGDSSTSYRLLELAPFERSDVVRSELEPFAIYATRSKAAMPVRFDSGRIVCANGMLKGNGIWKRHADLLDSSFKLFASSNFEVISGP